MKTVSFGPRGFPCGVGTHGSMPPSLPGLLGALRGLDEVVSAKNLFITHTFGGGIASEEELPRVVVVPMPLASALELVLNEYDVFDVDTLLVMLRSPHDIAQIADLIDHNRKLIDETAHTAHVSVQTETATATVGTTMHSIVNVREVCSLATFSSVTQARMVSSEVQCSPSQPQMVQRAVQVTPARVATRNAASGTTSWHELKQNTRERMRANAREEVLEEFEPALERVVVAAEVQVTRAAAKLEEARELKEAVRAGFESEAREAAAAAADRRAAAEDRKMLASTLSELASLRVAAALAQEERDRAEERVALLEREKIDFEDTQVGLLEMLHKAENSRCVHCSEA